MDSKSNDEKSLYTSIDVLDSQHQSFFNLIKRMRLQLLAPNSEEIDDIIDELFLYSLYHFETEERLLSSHNIQISSEHLEQHKIFQNKIEEFKINRAMGKALLNQDIIDLLENWITEHINRIDRDAFEPLKNLKDLNS